MRLERVIGFVGMRIYPPTWRFSLLLANTWGPRTKTARIPGAGAVQTANRRLRVLGEGERRCDDRDLRDKLGAEPHGFGLRFRALIHSLSALQEALHKPLENSNNLLESPDRSRTEAVG